jgi:hypothetical protein
MLFHNLSSFFCAFRRVFAAGTFSGAAVFFYSGHFALRRRLWYNKAIHYAAAPKPAAPRKPDYIVKV